MITEVLQERYDAPALTLVGFRLWIHGRQFPQATDESDSNWLVVSVCCEIEGAIVWVEQDPALEVGDVQRFLHQCVNLQTGRTRKAAFYTMEMLFDAVLTSERMDTLSIELGVTQHTHRERPRQHHQYHFDTSPVYFGTRHRGVPRNTRSLPHRRRTELLQDAQRRGVRLHLAVAGDALKERYGQPALNLGPLHLWVHRRTADAEKPGANDLLITACWDLPSAQLSSADGQTMDLEDIPFWLDGLYEVLASVGSSTQLCFGYGGLFMDFMRRAKFVEVRVSFRTQAVDQSYWLSSDAGFKVTEPELLGFIDWLRSLAEAYPVIHHRSSLGDTSQTHD